MDFQSLAKCSSLKTFQRNVYRVHCKRNTELCTCLIELFYIQPHTRQNTSKYFVWTNLNLFWSLTQSWNSGIWYKIDRPGKNLLIVLLFRCYYPTFNGKIYPLCKYIILWLGFHPTQLHSHFNPLKCYLSHNCEYKFLEKISLKCLQVTSFQRV